MRKSLFLGLLFFLSACGGTTYNSFVGEKYVVGQGGFVQDQYSAKDVDLEKTYPNGKVEYWSDGLPVGKRCKLIGYAKDSSKYRLTQEILKRGGNTATQSEVAFPIYFEKNGGALNVHNKGNNETHDTSFRDWKISSITYSGYNVFNCK